MAIQTAMVSVAAHRIAKGASSLWMLGTERQKAATMVRSRIPSHLQTAGQGKCSACFCHCPWGWGRWPWRSSCAACSRLCECSGHPLTGQHAAAAPGRILRMVLNPESLGRTDFPWWRWAKSSGLHRGCFHILSLSGDSQGQVLQWHGVHGPQTLLSMRLVDWVVSSELFQVGELDVHGLSTQHGAPWTAVVKNGVGNFLFISHDEGPVLSP